MSKVLKVTKERKFATTRFRIPLHRLFVLVHSENALEAVTGFLTFPFGLPNAGWDLAYCPNTKENAFSSPITHPWLCGYTDRGGGGRFQNSFKNHLQLPRF